MPWTVDDVEEHVKGLTPAKKRRWVAVANDALARCEDEGGKDCDARAIRQANAVVAKASEDGATGGDAPIALAPVSLPDSCFLYVPPGEPPSARKLPICNDSGSLDKGRVDAASAALSSGGHRGERVQGIPSSKMGMIKAKWRRAWKSVYPDRDPDEMPEHMKMSEVDFGIDEASSLAMFAVRDDPTAPAIHIYQPLAFATPPEWSPFLPIPGNYNHPLYGELDFSPEAYDQIIANFKSGTYQERIPVNAEHDVQASGAVGWITDMRRGDDGGIDARVEWNDRGKALIEDDRFRYVSAEVFDLWTDPVSGVDVPNVAVGMAICTNPYFKESVLRPLAASEAVITRVADLSAPRRAPRIDSSFVVGPTFFVEESNMSDKEEPKVDEPTKAKAADPIVAELSEATLIEVAELRQKATRDAQRATELAEENVRLRAAARVNLFTDEVRGKSEANGTPYIGHIPDHVRMLCDIAEKFGADSWHVQFYREQNRSHAEQMKAGTLYREIGTARGTDATQTAHDQIDALARELAERTGITYAQAFTKVLDSNAELRAAHARERQSGR